MNVKRAVLANELMQSNPIEDCWHGWPPQTWNGRTWKYIAPALLLERQSHELQRLRRLLRGMTERAARPCRHPVVGQTRRQNGLMPRKYS
jgi:hypothetical protein